VSLPAAQTIYTNAFSNCKILTTITIGEGCTVEDSSIRNGSFQTYYTTTKTKAAGVYTYNTGKSSWSYAPLEEEPTE
jgi:hypothetical protein